MAVVVALCEVAGQERWPQRSKYGTRRLSDRMWESSLDRGELTSGLYCVRGIGRAGGTRHDRVASVVRRRLVSQFQPSPRDQSRKPSNQLSVIKSWKALTQRRNASSGIQEETAKHEDAS
jgi:hypothetical protein